MPGTPPNLYSEEYELPDDTFLIGSITKPAVTDITTGAVSGTGIFDKLMVGINAQLNDQYLKNRITGAEYTKAYIALTEAALTQSVGFLLTKEKQYWETLVTQQQARTALVGVTTAKVQLEAVKRQAMLLNEQYEAARAQTVDTRSDGITAIAGTIGAQKGLYDQQKESYVQKTRLDVTKVFTDAFAIKKTVDSVTDNPLQFADNEIDEVVAALRTGVGM